MIEYFPRKVVISNWLGTYPKPGHQAWDVSWRNELIGNLLKICQKIKKILILISLPRIPLLHTPSDTKLLLRKILA